MLAKWTRAISTGALLPLAVLVIAVCSSPPQPERFAEMEPALTETVTPDQGPGGEPVTEELEGEFLDPEPMASAEPTATPAPEIESVPVDPWDVESSEPELELKGVQIEAPEPVVQVEEEGPEVEIETSGVHIYDEYLGAATPSVEERIYLAEVIVRATFISETKGLLNFRALEYLKGTGPTSFSLPAPGDRDTQWDEREAILFLSGSASASGARSTDATFDFVDTTTFGYGDDEGGRFQGYDNTNSYRGGLRAGVTVDSANPVWLASENTPGPDRSAGGGDYITGSAGGEESTISLTDLKAKIAWVTGGDGIEGYESCVQQALYHLRDGRDWEAYHNEPEYTPVREVEIPSGSPKDTDLAGWRIEPIVGRQYRWSNIEGEDAQYFAGRVEDDDDDPSNGFTEDISLLRPLPAGEYTFRSYPNNPRYRTCSFKPVYSGGIWNITVTSPAGTVHEAFFDPAGATAVGFDSQGGELEPAAFTVGGTASTVEALKYENGEVVLRLDPFNALTGLHLLFIELDGSIGLSLAASSATVDATAGTLTWSVAEAPWEAGDQLMLRITSTAPP